MAISEELYIKLNEEAGIGRNAQKAWDVYVKDFIIKRNNEIFESFCNAMNDEEVISIKKEHNALAELENSLRSDIVTGKMAQKQLDDDNG